MVKRLASVPYLEQADVTVTPENGPSMEETWTVVSDLYCNAVGLTPSFACEDLKHELLFCLLGGFGVSYEHGRSAATVVRELDPFGAGWRDDELTQEISQVLRQPQFEPRRRDGSLRSYRFPKRKAAVIVRARRWLLENASLAEQLQAMRTSKERRDILQSCPGIGPKTASWLLRNLGLGADLAIIDVHILRALAESGRVPESTRLPRDYDAAERAFLNWCDELHAPPAAFDLFVWHWQRGALRPVR